MKQSLYQISTEMQTLLEEVTQNEGELTPEIEEKIALITSQLTTKTDDVAAWVGSQDDLYFWRCLGTIELVIISAPVVWIAALRASVNPGGKSSSSSGTPIVINIETSIRTWSFVSVLFHLPIIKPLFS